MAGSTQTHFQPGFKTTLSLKVSKFSREVENPSESELRSSSRKTAAHFLAGHELEAKLFPYFLTVCLREK